MAISGTDPSATTVSAPSRHVGDDAKLSDHLKQEPSWMLALRGEFDSYLESRLNNALCRIRHSAFCAVFGTMPKQR